MVSSYQRTKLPDATRVELFLRLMPGRGYPVQIAKGLDCWGPTGRSFYMRGNADNLVCLSM